MNPQRFKKPGNRSRRGDVGYLNSVADAQAVLDAYHSGSASILCKTRSGFPVARVPGIRETNVNVGADIQGQFTDVFFIKGTAKPSFVPTNPSYNRDDI